MKTVITLATALILVWPSSPWAQAQPIGGKLATAATKATSAAVLLERPFNDKAGLDDARRGFIARPDRRIVKNAKGDVMWELASDKKHITPAKPAPDTVNPSLWRDRQLDMRVGLFPSGQRDRIASALASRFRLPDATAMADAGPPGS